MLWMQCDSCDKWRMLDEQTFKVCEGWDTFTCGKLDNCNCDMICDEKQKPNENRRLSQNSIKWICCDRCNAWRPVDEKSFQIASRHKGCLSASI